MRARRFAALVTLSGTVALTGWGVAGVGGLGSSGIENTATLMGHRATRSATYLNADARSVYEPLATAMASVVAVATSHLELPALADVPRADPDPPETRVQLATLSTSDPVKGYPTPAVRAVETPRECLLAEMCINEYLWSLYERTPKIDTDKVTERIKVTVKRKGKTRTVIKTNTRYVVADFTWKDPIAAQRAGMSLMDYVIGGMDRGFKLKLYRALRAMDDAGLMPGITSAFRDDYRQSIASGNKAASDSSYHGGSRRGGYGHGLAADLVSLKGETRMQRYGASDELWKWIDAHERELGIGRPYRDRDPPHVGPIDGKEYVDKRGGKSAGLQKKNMQNARLQTKKHQPGAGNDPHPTRLRPAKSAKQPRNSTGRQPRAGSGYTLEEAASSNDVVFLERSSAQPSPLVSPPATFA
jgi:hypothetical protein